MTDDIDRTDPDYLAFRSDWTYVYGESNCDMNNHDFSLWKWSRNREREACAAVAEVTICDVHLPTGVRVYGGRAAQAIRARGAR